MLILVKDKEQVQTLIKGGVKPVRVRKDGSIWIFKTSYSSMLLDSLRFQKEYDRTMAELAAFYRNKEFPKIPHEEEKSTENS
jgi:hypothetical protein